MSAPSLYDLAKELLDFCVVALDELPAGAPARRYVAVGLPALDCEQLTVHAFQVGEADTAPRETTMDLLRRGHPYARLNLAFLVITIARECYPGPTAMNMQVPEPPTVVDLVAASETIYADGWQLWNAVPTALRDGALFSACRFVGWQPMQPLGPEGGMAGWTMPIQVQIDGFEPAPPV